MIERKLFLIISLFIFIYSLNIGLSKVSLAETIKNTVVVVVGDGPADLLFKPSNNNVYVANKDSGTVSIIISI
jgi:DNA-binding beta-propeller fold protein YncE